jgi:AraC-like DNA-binding protein
MTSRDSSRGGPPTRPNIRTVLTEPEWRANESFVVFERRRFVEELSTHKHREPELTLIRHGRGLRRVVDRVEEYADGDLCLFGENTPHVWQAAPGEVVSAIIVRIDPIALAGWSAAPELARLGQLLARARVGLAVTGRARDRIAELLCGMLHEPPGSWRRVVLLLTALGILVEANDCAPIGAHAHRGGRAAQRLAEVRAFMEENLSDALSQADVARRYGLGPSTFSRWFRRAAGRTFQQFVNELRVARACAALAGTDQKVTDIAFDVGYGSMSNFNRQFRRIKGLAPEMYRHRACGGGGQGSKAAESSGG